MKWNILYLRFQNKLTFAITLYCRNMLRNFLRQQCTHETWIWFGHWIVRERVRTNLQFYILKPCLSILMKCIKGQISNSNFVSGYYGNKMFSIGQKANPWIWLAWYRGVTKKKSVQTNRKAFVRILVRILAK